MPIYCYRCPSCDRRTSRFRTMAERNDGLRCEGCGEETVRDLHAEVSPSGEREFRVPIEMYSVACTTQEEVDDLRRRVPDVQFAPHDSGVPLARTRREKLAILEATGFVELN